MVFQDLPLVSTYNDTVRLVTEELRGIRGSNNHRSPSWPQVLEVDHPALKLLYDVYHMGTRGERFGEGLLARRAGVIYFNGEIVSD